MSRPSLYSFALLLFTLALPSAQGQEVKAPAPISATEVERLMQLEGEVRTVQGLIARTNINLTGIHFLNFADTTFLCITFPRFLANFTEGTPSELFEGTYVKVTGTIEIYRGQPQIKLEHPDQIEVLETPPPAPEPEPEPKPEPTTEEKPEEKEPSPDAASETLSDTAADGRKLEVVNGKPALDWRLYFPD